MKFRIQLIVICALFIYGAYYLQKNGAVSQTIETKYLEVDINEWDVYDPYNDTIIKLNENDTLPWYSLEDSLDNDPNIIHWEVWNDTLHIYTKADSARDELERIRYIMNLEHEFDSLFNMELENNN